MRRSSLIKTSGFAIALVVAWRLASELEHARREAALVRVSVRAREGNDAAAPADGHTATHAGGHGPRPDSLRAVAADLSEKASAGAARAARAFRDTGIEVEEFATAPVSAAPIDLLEVTVESLAATPFTHDLAQQPAVAPFAPAVVPLVRATAAPQVAGSPLHSVPQPGDIAPTTPSLPVAVVFSGGPEPDLMVPLAGATAADEAPAAVTHTRLAESYAAVTHTPLAEATEIAPESFTTPGVITPATASRAQVAELSAGVARIYPSAAAAVAAAEVSHEAEVMVPTGSAAVASAAPSALSRLEPLTPIDQPTVMQPAVMGSEAAAISAALDRSIAQGTAVHEATIANVLERSERVSAADEYRVPRAWPWLLLALGGMGAVAASLAVPLDQNAWSYAGGGVGTVLVSFIGSRYGSAAARARAGA